MALKPDRDYNEVTDITCFWSTGQTSAERGGVASMSGSQGSGAAIGANYTDDPNIVYYVTNPSGAIAKGVLIETVAPAMSTNRDFINYDAGEIRPGDKCTLIKKGFVVTNMITGSAPTAGAAAYLAASGYISTTNYGSASPQIGRFETTKDANGYARVSIDIT